MVETISAKRTVPRSDLIEACRAVHDSVLDKLTERLERLDEAEERLRIAERRFDEGEQGIILKASKSFYGEFDRSLANQTTKLQETVDVRLIELMQRFDAETKKQNDEIRRIETDADRRIKEMQRTHRLEMEMMREQIEAIRQTHVEGFTQIADIIRSLPIPQVVNNLPELNPNFAVNVNPTPINVVPSPVENRIEVNPTPIEVDNHVHVPQPQLVEKEIIYDQSSRPWKTLERPMPTSTTVDEVLRGEE